MHPLYHIVPPDEAFFGSLLFGARCLLPIVAFSCFPFMGFEDLATMTQWSVCWTRPVRQLVQSIRSDQTSMFVGV